MSADDRVKGPGPRISALEELVKAAAGKGRPPVERWNPPYCGDIGLAIRADGTWTYRGSPIGRLPLVKLFASVLIREPDGRFFLVTPAEKVDVAVADAPFLAVEMEARGHGDGQKITFRTNVDDIVDVGCENPLCFTKTPDGGLKPYVRVRGRLEALVSRALVYDLVELALEAAPVNPGGQPGLWSGGQFYPLERPSGPSEGGDEEP